MAYVDSFDPSNPQGQRLMQPIATPIPGVVTGSANNYVPDEEGLFIIDAADVQALLRSGWKIVG